MNILENNEQAAKGTLPSRGGGGSPGHRKATPGWSEFVQPYLEESKFCHSLRDSAGKPLAGALFDAMKQTKKQ